MAAEKKAGDNKLFQLVMVLITSIVAPLTVYFATHALDATNTSKQPTALISTTAPSLTSAPESTALAAASPTMANSPVPNATPSPTAFAVVNPHGMLPAGTPAASGALAVWAAPGDAYLEGKILHLSLHLRNFSDQAQTLAFSMHSITVRDKGGNAFEVMMGAKHNECRKQSLDSKHEVVVAAGEEVVLQSVSADAQSDWCAEGAAKEIPLYSMPAKYQPGPLQVAFDGFGPFKGFSLEILPQTK